MSPKQMPSKASQGETALLNKDHRDVLDIIDSLRSKGIGRYIDLPQIIVCGDQSSGKSSVLEAISGMAFPTKDALCTRFATELILRRASTEDLKVSIIPGPGRTEEECSRLTSFNPSTDKLGSIIEEAQKLMGLSGTKKVFATDILRVEVSSPTQPHLTLVDLPGLFVAGNKDQSVEDAKLVGSLVSSYMSQPRSIILAVISAKSEFALQQITERAKEHDPKGIRTIGLITKPDTLDEGSEGEQAYINLAKNTDVYFRLGWHVVKNRDFKQRGATKKERDDNERQFFSKGVWKSLSASQLGIGALITRLSKVLHDHNLKNLPQVLQEIDTGIETCEKGLEKLGDSRSTLREQRRYLMQLSRDFTILVKAAVNGDYSDRSFFPDSEEANARRFRARINNEMTQFSQRMRQKGHTKEIVENGLQRTENLGNNRVKMSREEFVRQVSLQIQRNRGRELPGTFDPLIVGDLFRTQCKPWEKLADHLVARVLDVARNLLGQAIEYVADEETAERIMRRIISNELSTLADAVESKLDELLSPHIEGHPITFNHYLTENIQQVQKERHAQKIKKAFEAFGPIAGPNPNGPSRCTVDLHALLNKTTAVTEPDMDDFAATTAIDTMEAYYKVAMKKFTDDVCVLAIEQCVIKKLPSIFSADDVYDMADDDIAQLAGESDEASAQRTILADKLEVLTLGQEQLSVLSKGAPISGGNTKE